MKISMFSQNRIIFLVYLILIASPYIIPLAFPIHISENSLAFNKIIQSVPAGSAVFWDTDGNFQMWPDFGGGEIAVYKVLFTLAKEKNVRLVFAQFGSVEASTIAQNTIDDLTNQGYTKGLTYGVNYVNFGYLPGGEAMMAAFAADIHKTCKTDVRGTLVDQIPMMSKITDLKSFYFVGWGGFGFEPQVRQWSSYGIPLLTNQTSTLLANIVSWYQKGLIAGYLGGQNGSAEFEFLTGYFGIGTSASSGQLFAHIYAIVLLVIPNIYFIYKGRTKR